MKYLRSCTQQVIMFLSQWMIQFIQRILGRHLANQFLKFHFLSLYVSLIMFSFLRTEQTWISTLRHEDQHIFQIPEQSSARWCLDSISVACVHRTNHTQFQPINSVYWSNQQVRHLYPIMNKLEHSQTATNTFLYLVAIFGNEE